jgi:hypothetical protein
LDERSIRRVDNLYHTFGNLQLNTLAKVTQYEKTSLDYVDLIRYANLLLEFIV